MAETKSQLIDCLSKYGQDKLRDEILLSVRKNYISYNNYIKN